MPGPAPSEPVDRDPGTCSTCRSTDVTQLPMVLTDGTPATFVSCRRCEAREWLTPTPDGGWETIPIETVLERSARKPR